MILFLGALALASPVSAGTDSDEQEASVTLLRPDPNVGTIHGSVEIGTKTSDGSENFKVEIEDADLPGAHDLYIESAVGSGTMNFDQTLPVDGNGFKLELDTADGDSMPLGASTAELSLRRVEIKVGSTVVLAGTIPEFSSFEAELRGEAPLTRPALAPDSDAKGEVEVRSEPHKGRERFKVEIEHVDSQLVHELYLEDPADSGQMALVDSFTFDGSDDGDDELQFERDTKDGVNLPVGAATAEELVGRRIEVHAAGAVVLEGTVPGFTALKKKQKSETLLVRPDPAPDPDAKGKMKLKSEPFKGNDELKIEVKNINSSVAHDVYMEDAVGSGVMAKVGTLVPDGSNELKFELDTKKGDVLPFLAVINADLADRRVEIQVQSSGQVVLYGIVPSVNTVKQTQKGATFVVRPDASPDPDAVASMKLKTEVHKGRERFEVTVKKADTAVVHNLYLEDGAGSGTMVLVGPLVVQGKKLRYRIDTKVGQGLPLATASNTFLDGRRVEIRLEGGTVVLVGKVPSVSAGKQGKKKRKAQTKLAAAGASPNPLVTGKLKLSSRPSKGDERIELAAKKLDFSGTDYHVFIEDAAGSGVFQDVGLLDHKGTSTKGRFRRQTKKGQSLPFGVNGVADLALRLFEVRDDAGAVYLDGTIPAVQ